MLIKRIATSVILIALMSGTVAVDWLCGLFITASIVLGLYEFFTILEKKGISIYKYFGIGMGTVIPLDRKSVV